MMRGLLVKRGKLNASGTKLNKPYIENMMAKKFAVQPHEMKQEDQIEKMIPRDSVKRKTMSKFIAKKLVDDKELEKQALQYCKRVFDPRITLADPRVKSELDKRKYERDAWSMYSVLFKVEQEEAEIDKEFVMGFIRWLKGVGDDSDHQKTPWYRQPIRHPAVDEFLGAWAKEKAEYLRQLDLTKNMPCKFILRTRPLSYTS